MKTIKPILAALLPFVFNTAAPAQTSCETNAEFPQIDPALSCVSESFVQTDGSGIVDWVTQPTAPFASACTHGLTFPYTGKNFSPVLVPSGEPTGFRLGINLLSSPSPGDFLPPAPSLAAGSAALVPPGAGTIDTTWQGGGRPTLGGVVDLVTGLPLVQVTDLELPFAGATFRLNRTRSGNRDDMAFGANSLFQIAAADRWWDWTGVGWMASENPILILDAALPDVTGDHPRTSWLVLDAHHSIPFQQIESSGLYAAPPRFKARLTHNGVWDQAQRSWATPPTQYEAFLYDGALHYTFVVIREDVPPNDWDETYIGQPPSPDYSSYHDRPFTPNQFHAVDPGDPRGLWHSPYSNAQNPGFGIPYYALCTRIEDQHDHVVEIEYCSTWRRDVDDVTTTECRECRQDCLAKGQIRSIKLKSPDQSGVEQTHWTLLYSHRRFRGESLRYNSKAVIEWLYVQYPEFTNPSDPSGTPVDANAEIYEIFGSVAIDRIYVFEGDIDDALLAPACFTLTHHDRPMLNDGLDPLSAYNAGVPGAQQIREDYKHLVRYHYEYDHDDSSLRYGESLNPALLLKTTVESTHGEPAITTTNTTIFHYDDGPAAGNPAEEPAAMPWLELVFHDDDIGRLLDSADDLSLPPWFSADNLATWRDDTDTFDLPQAVVEAVKPFASLRFDRGPNVGYASPLAWPSSATDWAPDPQALFDNDPVSGGGHGQYILQEPGRVKQDGHAHTVGSLSLRASDGAIRHFRIHRLAVLPSSLGGGDPFHLEFVIPGYDNAMRSAFAHPYLWHGYLPNGTANRAHTDPVDLTQARWISIIEEFASRETMDDPVYDYQGSAAVKLGANGDRAQLDRRIVEMNASGLVLRERHWEYTDTGIARSGSGLGEEFIYDTVSDYFGGTLPGQTDTDPSDGIQIDPWTNVRDDLILVEHRSVGWSAGDDQQRLTEGLVRFFEYDIFGDPVTTPAEEMPFESRVQLVAEGIRRGLNGVDLYTRQIMRDADRPNDVLAQVEFTQPTSSLLTTLPGYSQDPDESFTLTSYETEWADDPDMPDTEQRIVSRMVVGPPHQVRPGSAWYYPVEREWYDDDGNAVWSSTGELIDPSNPSSSDGDPFASLIFTYYDRDWAGRSQHTVIDAGAGSVLSSSHPQAPVVTIPAYPGGGWDRKAVSGPPENALTSFLYDLFAPGLCDVWYPNGRQWARRIITINTDPDNPFAREFVFNDVVHLGGSDYEAHSPGQVKDYFTRDATGPVREDWRVDFVGTFRLGFGEASAPTYEPYWRIDVGLDANGRIQRADLIEYDPTGAPLAVGSREVNDLGELYRQREIDGTIRTTIRNRLGQDLRSYVGTMDDGWFGGVGGGGDNMILVNRTEWGSGINDAWLPTVSRRYESQPAWASDHHGEVGSDPDGFASVTSYDWRMRPVRMDTYDKGDPFGGSPPQRLSTTLTYLDHGDRPRLEVRFGQGTLALPAGLDPADLVDSDPIPDTSQFYGLGLVPLSITETHYGPDGSVTERRMYDVASASPRYQAEYSYTGRGGQRVYAQSPGQAIQVTRLDSLARMQSSASVLPGGGEYELTRTDYAYDGDGNTIETTRWTRVIEDANPTLDLTNAVRSRSVAWHDAQKRLIASAELGTEQDAFVAGPASFVRGNSPWWDQSSNTVYREGVPDEAALRIFIYDRQGNQTHVVNPNGAVTESVYSSTGRLVRRIENSRDADVQRHRITSYEHEYGRVVKMIADADPGAPGGPGGAGEQETEVVYVSKVVDEAFNVVSGNNGLVGLMHLPGLTQDPCNGCGDLATPEADIALRYDFAGRIAERTDARGVTFRYRYESLGRLASITVGHYTGSGSYVDTYPPSMSPSSGDPVDRVGYVEYDYDARENLAIVSAYDSPDPATRILITQNQYDYDARGNLLADWQSFGAPVTSASPSIEYTWAYAPTTASEAGHTRLMRMLYPAPAGEARRAVTIGYGASGATSDVLSRIETMSSNLHAPPIASFAYVGAGRRSAMFRGGNKLIQDLVSSNSPGDIGLSGLDAFGRVQDLLVENHLGQTLFRSLYTYDVSGNRLTAEITQSPVGAAPFDNVRSQLNRYDPLNRLIGTDVGTLTWDSYGVPSITNAVQSDSWNLDPLSNWTGTAPFLAPDDVGRHTSGNLDGYGTPWALPGADASIDTRSIVQTVNQRNEITVLSETLDGPSVDTSMQYDAAGNLTYDGEYFYQYDAWNRLVQVNEASWNAGLVVGDQLKHFTYDGTGRLVRTTSPYPDPGSSDVRSEWFYYDGIRRIQELATDAPAPGRTGRVMIPFAAADPQPAAAGLTGGSTPLERSIEREYIWGPGDNGFDECLVQFDASGDAWWLIQDAGGDVVALCDLKGPSTSARVLGQWTYDPYGALIAAEHATAPFPQMHLGHKGLFIDRLDVGLASGATELPRLVPYAHLVCQNRNRAYLPVLGRFAQPDPNATGTALLSSADLRGLPSPATLSLRLSALYVDGLNRFNYLRSNPLSYFDPLGLSTDPFAAVDEYLAETTGNRAAALAQLGQNMKAIAVTAASILSYLPIPAANFAGELALVALGEQTFEQAIQGAALGLIPGGKVLLKTKAAVGRVSVNNRVYSAHYATRGPHALANIGNQPVRLSRVGVTGVRHRAAILAGGNTHWVYMAYRGRTPVYVGSTGQPLRQRWTSSRRKKRGFDTVMRIYNRKVPAILAKAIETVIIEYNPELENIDRGIGPAKPYYDDALVAAARLMKRANIPFRWR